MKTLTIQISDILYDQWSKYAEDAGIPIESLMLEATRFSVKSDRLGVEDTKIQELQRQTREAELKSRLLKAQSINISSKKESVTPKVNNTAVEPDELPTASIDDGLLSDSINMADLEEAVSREH